MHDEIAKLYDAADDHEAQVLDTLRLKANITWEHVGCWTNLITEGPVCDECNTPFDDIDITERLPALWPSEAAPEASTTSVLPATDEPEVQSTTSPYCDHCVPDTTWIADLTRTLSVARTPSGVVVIDSSGADSVLVTFDEEPTPDPVPDDDDAVDAAFAADPELFARSEEWVAAAHAAFAGLADRLGLRGSWQLVGELMAAGYDQARDGDVEVWLFDRIGRALTANLPESEPANAGCDTCGGNGRWMSTTEDSPDRLVDLGECPDCAGVIIAVMTGTTTVATIPVNADTAITVTVNRQPAFGVDCYYLDPNNTDPETDDLPPHLNLGWWGPGGDDTDEGGWQTLLRLDPTQLQGDNID